jgi:hypothetical protein
MRRLPQPERSKIAMTALITTIAIAEALALIACVALIDNYRTYAKEYIRLVGKVRAETAVNAELARRAERISHG